MASPPKEATMASTPTTKLPREVRGRDGRSIRLREIETGDRDEVVALARTLAPDDLLFLRTDITQPDVVEDWIRNVQSGRTYSVLAEVEGKLAGYSSVHTNSAQWMRDVGEIRVIVGPAYRRLNLGRILIEEVFNLARANGLRKLTAQMTPDQGGARAVFQALGFKAEALLGDYVTDRSGTPRDLLIMTYDITGFNDHA
jgi:L-amino acid N-acyltransferase YncA